MGQTVTFESVNPNPDFDTVKDVQAEEVLSKKDQLLLVDVRRPDEWEGELGHVPGAMHLILDELPQRMDELPRDQTIVFVCRSGKRSANASQFAIQNGIDGALRVMKISTIIPFLKILVIMQRIP